MSLFVNHMFSLIKLFLLILLLFQSCYVTFSANILAITPLPILTHQTAFRPLWKELAKRGHNITLLTTNPMNDNRISNIKEIDAGFCYKILEKYNATRMASDESVSFLDVADAIMKCNTECFEAQLSSPEGQNLLHNTDNNFDLLFMEAHLSNMIGFSWKYNIPFIGIATLDCQFTFHEMAGNEVHPITNPDINIHVEDYRNPTFKERLTSTVYFYLQRFLRIFIYGKRTHEVSTKYFGKDLPPFAELRNNMAMLFITTNPLFHPPRAQLPNTINLWQNLEMEDRKPLPKDLDKFIGNAKNGLVYFSLGSFVDEDLINSTTKQDILAAFRDLPYHFIWRNKDRGYKLQNIPINVLVEDRWLPQQDILRHQNTKLFITHAGINSLFETAYFGVPALGIPFLGDQLRNAEQIKNLGIGLKLSKKNLTRESITWAVRELIENQRYAEKSKEVQKIFNDLDEPPLQKAVWWTEYVLRHKNVAYLKNPANLYPWWQYYLLDTIGFITAFILISLYLLKKIFCWALAVLNCLSFRKKLKQS